MKCCGVGWAKFRGLRIQAVKPPIQVIETLELQQLTRQSIQLTRGNLIVKPVSWKAASGKQSGVYSEVN